MKRYVVIIRFTEQGAREIKKSAASAAAFCNAAEKCGVRVETQFWTAGSFDGILVLRAADATKALGVIAKLAAVGNVRTETLQAFDAREFATIVGK